jgi:deazaflavin-dependent oxidoreductase (nitroreductase family)
MSQERLRVQKPNALEAAFNRLFGWLVGLGLAPANFYVLEVVGRKSGRVYSTPVDLLVLEGRKFLVSPRGETQWARNARASGKVVLRRGRVADEVALRALTGPEKPDVLKAYLDTFKSQVGRFFPVAAGSPREAFVPLADRYPAFEVTPRS